MSTTATVLLVAGVGGAAFLYFRSQQQQSSLLAAAVAGGGTAPAGGGVGGLAQRVFNQWKADPLGVKNTQAAISTVTGVVKSGASEVGSVVHSIGSAIGGLF
jgi:hypothetical protein